MIASHEEPEPSAPQVGARERRHGDRFDGTVPTWVGERVGSSDEVERLKQNLASGAQQMAQLRGRNEQLMAVNSDLRCKLGEMTLRWVDASNV